MFQNELCIKVINLAFLAAFLLVIETIFNFPPPKWLGSYQTNIENSDEKLVALTAIVVVVCFRDLLNKIYIYNSYNHLALYLVKIHKKSKNKEITTSVIKTFFVATIQSNNLQATIIILGYFKDLMNLTDKRVPAEVESIKKQVKELVRVAIKEYLGEAHLNKKVNKKLTFGKR
jgi:hypothetical protein